MHTKLIIVFPASREIIVVFAEQQKCFTLLLDNDNYHLKKASQPRDLN